MSSSSSSVYNLFYFISVVIDETNYSCFIYYIFFMVIIGSLLIKLVQIFFNIISEIFVREMCYLIILCNSNSNLFKYFKILKEYILIIQ